MSQRKRKNTDHGEGSRRQRGEHVVASPSVDERDLDESVGTQERLGSQGKSTLTDSVIDRQNLR